MSPFSLRQMLSNLRLRHTSQGNGPFTDHDVNLLDATKGLSDSRGTPPTPTADIQRHTFVEDYRRPPPLPQVTLGKDIEFVGQSNLHGATPMFIIRAGENVLLLKVVRPCLHRLQLRLTVWVLVCRQKACEARRQLPRARLPPGPQRTLRARIGRLHAPRPLRRMRQRRRA